MTRASAPTSTLGRPRAAPRRITSAARSGGVRAKPALEDLHRACRVVALVDRSVAGDRRRHPAGVHTGDGDRVPGGKHLDTDRLGESADGVFAAT